IAQFREGDVIADRYRLERQLGLGGMGLVYAAMHIELERRVAIKLLRHENRDNSEALARFTLEARATARLNGPHVTKILDVGRHSDVPYIVMEYLEGTNLQQLLEERDALPISQAVDYTLEACEALAEAHRAGIVHRDLKPANLFLTRNAYGEPLIKVLDFGISKVLEAADHLPVGLTDSRTLIGSPVYMSPEQMRSARDVDHRTDIWSIGAVLFELLTGRPLWTGASLSEVCAQVTRDPTPRLRDYAKGISPELSDVIDRCLEKDANLRYQQVSDLAIALGPFASVQGKVTIDRVLLVAGYSIHSGTGGAITTATLSSERPGNVTLEGTAATRSGSSFPLRRLALLAGLMTLVVAIALVVAARYVLVPHAPATSILRDATALGKEPGGAPAPPSNSTASATVDDALTAGPARVSVMQPSAPEDDHAVKRPTASLVGRRTPKVTPAPSSSIPSPLTTAVEPRAATIDPMSIRK
ncbi:MAG TPA: serine/threonine-protein kinase, partial [Polyangiaceae bacterium]